MNALVGIRGNSTGSLSLPPQKRLEVAQQIQSNVSASQSGNALKALQLKASSTTGVLPADQSLGKDAFLQLLVTQMKYQDPMAPMDNTQMLSQLAQFSSLEQMNNLNGSFQAVGGNIDQLNFISASGMIGRNVQGLDVDGNPISGVVSHVQMEGSVVYLSVGDQRMSMAGVYSIA